jgi:hypothetical protein
MPAPDTSHVLCLWAAVVFFSVLEAWAFPGDVRAAPGAAYIATNVLVFFAALVLLAHCTDRHEPAPTHRRPRAEPHGARPELTHLFVHLMCVAYLRLACWFEARAAGQWFVAEQAVVRR